MPIPKAKENRYTPYGRSSNSQELLEDSPAFFCHFRLVGNGVVLPAPFLTGATGGFTPPPGWAFGTGPDDGPVRGVMTVFVDPEKDVAPRPTPAETPTPVTNPLSLGP